jgi:plasmid stabilization system protein ParE
MIEIRWTGKALSDLTRLYDFLAAVNRPAAAKAVQALVAGPQVLIGNPRIGERLDEFDPREVRRILVGRYEMRYELDKQTAYILRIWHAREDR